MRPSDPPVKAFLEEMTELSRKHNLVVSYDGTLCALSGDARATKGACAYTLDEDNSVCWEELPALDSVCEKTNYGPSNRDSEDHVEILMLPRAS